MRAGHITTMLDMQANLTGHSAQQVAHIALRQVQAVWWLQYSPNRHTGMLLSELAERLCETGRMDGTMLPVSGGQLPHMRQDRVVSARDSQIERRGKDFSIPDLLRDLPHD
jgi:hypothetical protein